MYKENSQTSKPKYLSFFFTKYSLRPKISYVKSLRQIWRLILLTTKPPSVISALWRQHWDVQLHEKNRQSVSPTRCKEHQIHDQTQQSHPGVVSGAVTMGPHCPRDQGVRVTPTLTCTICQVCNHSDTWSIDDRLPNLRITKSTLRVFYTVFTPTEKSKIFRNHHRKMSRLCLYFLVG